MSSFKDFLFKTEEGAYVYGQKPNWPVYVVLALLAVEFMLPSTNSTALCVRGVYLAVLAYWAAIELVDGVNLFRRLLGVLVLCLALYGVILMLS